MKRKILINLFYNSVFKMHLALWLTFFMLKLSVLLYTGVPYSLTDFVLSHLLIIGVFYVNVFYVLPFYKNRKHIRFFANTFILFSFYAFFRYFIKFIIVYDDNVEFHFQKFIAEVFYLFFQFYIVSIGYRYSIDRERKMIKIEEEKAVQQELAIERQKDHLQTELAFLKAQINPHFLYNTLSFLYVKATKVSPVLAESIMTLSEIMRYALSNDVDSNGTVLIEDEIVQIQNLIKIHELRFDSKFCVEFKLNADFEGQRIIPLIIITIIENSFKHGVFNNPDDPIEIEISLKESLFSLKCSNGKNNVLMGSSGLGLKMSEEGLTHITILGILMKYLKPSLNT